MQDLNKTVSIVHAPALADFSSSLQFTIFDGNERPRTVLLDRFNRREIYFGRGSGNDIKLSSLLVSHQHGRFCFKNNRWVIEDKAAYDAQGSTNGLIYNNTSVVSRTVGDGDLIRIDDGEETIPEGVLFVFSSSQTANKWQSLPLGDRPELNIGREESCDIVLPHVSVSKFHAKIIREQDGYYIIDNGSTNGVIVNNKPVSAKQRLYEKDVISITNSKMIFTSSMIFYCCFKNGISVDASDVVITRREKGKKKITCNHVSVSIKPGELVAIIGGSGAGKSTVLNCMCGYLEPDEGDVYISGVELYHNFDSLKKLIGYVPQMDIVYDDLTVYDMLVYTARLRLPGDMTTAEREKAINKALETVELADKKNSLIKQLSGGQRKRASIAVELLSDPNLLFLDEPASGLDPGTERNLMCSLRNMADAGKTVILVTHSTLQLKLCDKIIFMGRGGNLCYFGSYDEALDFFEVRDVVDIYSLITERAEDWTAKYLKTLSQTGKPRAAAKVSSRRKKNTILQLWVLCKRYLKLITNDIQRLMLLLVQAPALAFLISLVANGKQFEQYEMTKSLLFALSCSAFWIGMLNAIQEVCKERTILKREFMTGLSLGAYIASKIIVLGLLCLIQSLLVVSVFAFSVGLPEEGLFISPYAELLFTTFLTAIASAAMGLFVSSLFYNADRAMTVAPILLMPQILFSGLIFKLDGATEIISWLAVCRWSMEGYGITANLNALPLKLQQEGIMIPHESEAFFDFTASHMLASWGILIVYTAIFLVMARFALAKMKKEKA